MGVELNWHEGEHIPSHDGRGDTPAVVWETEPTPLPAAPREAVTIARSRPAAPRWLRPRLVALLVGVPLAVVALAAGVLYWRAHQGEQAARQDIEATLQTLLDARRDGDQGLLTKLLDPSDPVWQEQQREALLAAPADGLPDQVRVTSVALRGDYALAEVVEVRADGPPLRKRVPLYRVENVWRLAPGDPALLGPEGVQQSTHFTVYYRQVDEPFVPDLINAAEGAYVTLCSELRCRGSGPQLSVRLMPPGVDGPTFEAGVLVVPSPWQLGVDPAGRPTPAFYHQLTRQIGWRLAQIKAPEAAPALWSAVGDWAAAELANIALPDDIAFVKHIRDGRQPLPLDALWRSVAIDNDARPLIAAQFRLMLTFMQESYGPDAVGRLLEGAPRHLHQILRRRFGADVQSLEAAWRQWLKGATIQDATG
ncbi:MAG: hypothetical protein NZ528_11840 [Caldilineales bacterium]|nr:hypothetical protein [Caldilineales bacterium]MDW8319059.1 hypothetical protein [Anaerolineae bacterium]